VYFTFSNPDGVFRKIEKRLWPVPAETHVPRMSA